MILNEILFTFFFFSFLSLLLSVDDFYASSVRQTFEEKKYKNKLWKRYEHGTTCVQERGGVSDYRSIIFGNKRVSLL